jgi:hypothetical protein
MAAGPRGKCGKTAQSDNPPPNPDLQPRHGYLLGAGSGRSLVAPLSNRWVRPTRWRSQTGDLTQGISRATGNFIMPLSKLTETDLRDGCRARLEMLELWLRRLIHEEFQKAYSADILNAKTPAGDFVLKKEIRENIAKKMTDQPERYKRPVDAALLDNLITIICKPDTYKRCFATALKDSFPQGAEEARNFLDRLLILLRHK